MNYFLLPECNNFFNLIKDNYIQSLAKARAVNKPGKGSQNAAGANIVIATMAIRCARKINQYLPVGFFKAIVVSVI
jgi:hypothetical protein